MAPRGPVRSRFLPTVQKMPAAGAGRAPGGSGARLWAAVAGTVTAGLASRTAVRAEVWDSHPLTDSAVCDASPRNRGGRKRSLRQNVWAPSRGSRPGG